jgi:hypothetical protein
LFPLLTRYAKFNEGSMLMLRGKEPATNGLPEIRVSARVERSML